MERILTFNEWCTQPKLNECVIAKFEVSGNVILVKNRDRAYVAPIEIIHTLIDGVEVAYLHDKITDWSEGINEFGIGVVNSSLQVKFDEKEGDIAKKSKKTNGPKPSRDGLKIRTALSKKNLDDAIKSIVEFKGQDPKKVGVKGETIVSNDKESVVIELTSQHEPVMHKVPLGELIVRTNHGIDYPDVGYTKGEKRKSSISRMKTATDELTGVESVEDALNKLAQRATKDNFLNPYRDAPHAKMHTTAQLGYDLKNRILYVRYDEKFGKFEGISTDLPMGYKPKIQIVVSPVTEEMKKTDKKDIV